MDILEVPRPPCPPLPFATGGLGSAYRQLFERSPVPQLFVEPATSRITGANAATAVFYGYRSGDLIGMPLGALSTLPEERLGERLGQAARGERTSFREEHRFSNGSACLVEVHATPVETEAGPQLHLLVRDATPDALARQAAERSGRLLDALLDSAPLVVFVVDREERLCLARGKGLAALPRRRFLGRTVSELYGEDSDVVQNVRRALGGEAFTATVAARGASSNAPTPRSPAKSGAMAACSGWPSTSRRGHKPKRRCARRTIGWATSLRACKRRARRNGGRWRGRSTTWWGRR